MDSIKLNSPWSGAAAWARINADGVLELELYDHSEQAAQSLGGDVAWIWTADAAQARTALDVENDGELLGALKYRFADVHAARDWLRNNGVALTEYFDSQA